MRFRRFRVLVPWLAKPFYVLARGRVATWDPVMFGLLVADSLFVAGTAVLIFVLGSRKLGSSAVGPVGTLLYLVNFAVPNLRLVGLVDAGEGFFLLALLWSLSEFELWTLPVIGVLGALTKESFIPFSIVFTTAWWFSTRPDSKFRQRAKSFCAGRSLDPDQLGAESHRDGRSAMVDHRHLRKSAAVWSRASSRRRLPLRCFAARSKSLVHLSVAIAHRNPRPEALSKIVAHSSRRDLRHGICAGRIFWGTAGSRIGLGQSAL